jgi:GDP-D-mannose 3',5'-epimerase
MQFRVFRFHNIYGPQGTWKGGREKAPAAFCRKAIANDKIFDMWGDGHQTRSFCYIDDAVEGVYRLMTSDFSQPINIGSEEMISMNDMAKLAMSIEGKDLEINHIPGPEGVRGRNSDNTLIRKVTTALAERPENRASLRHLLRPGARVLGVLDVVRRLVDRWVRSGH